MTTRTTSEAKLLAKAAKIMGSTSVVIKGDGSVWNVDRFVTACIYWLDACVVDSQHELMVRKHGSTWIVSWRKGVIVDVSLHIALAKAVIAVSKEEKSHEVPMPDRR